MLAQPERRDGVAMHIVMKHQFGLWKIWRRANSATEDIWDYSLHTGPFTALLLEERVKSFRAYPANFCPHKSVQFILCHSSRATTYCWGYTTTVTYLISRAFALVYCAVQCALSLPEGNSHPMDHEHRYQSVVKWCANIWGMDDVQDRSVHIQRTMGADALTHVGPHMLLSAFPPAGPYTPALAKFNHKLMLIAPHWPVLHWLAKKYRILCAQPCQLPLHKDFTLSKLPGLPPLGLCMTISWESFSSGLSNGTTSPFSFCVSDTAIFMGLIDKGKAFYTLKIYLAAIAVCYIDYCDETAR